MLRDYVKLTTVHVILHQAVTKSVMWWCKIESMCAAARWVAFTVMTFSNIFPIEIIGRLCHFCVCKPWLKVGVLYRFESWEWAPFVFVVLSVCIHSHVEMFIVFVFVYHGLLFRHWFLSLTKVPIAAGSCASAGHDECRSMHNHHIVYGHGFSLQVRWLCRCQKRSSSVAWNWRQKKTCHSKLSHLLDPKCTPLN